MRRVLFVTFSLPLPPDSGDRQRTNLLYRALRRHADVDLLVIGDASRIAHDVLERLRREFGLLEIVNPLRPGERGLWHAMWRFAPRFADSLARRTSLGAGGFQQDWRVRGAVRALVKARRYDLIVTRYIRSLALMGPVEDLPVAIDIDGLDDEIHRSRLQLPNLGPRQRLALRVRARKLWRIIPRVTRHARLAWVSNSGDLRRLKHPNAHLLPNIAFDPPGEALPTDPNSRVILFVGNMRHRVNVDGLKLFLENSWKTIRSAVPDATLRIVGSGMDERLRRRYEHIAGVVPVGFVENLAVEYGLCAFSVVPLLDGRGTKIKVLESLTYGRTVVLAAHSWRGYEDALQHRRDVWIGGDFSAIAEGCVQLLRDPTRRNAMAESGRRQVLQSYTFERFANIVDRTTEPLLFHRQTTHAEN